MRTKPSPSVEPSVLSWSRNVDVARVEEGAVVAKPDREEQRFVVGDGHHGAPLGAVRAALRVVLAPLATKVGELRLHRMRDELVDLGDSRPHDHHGRCLTRTGDLLLVRQALYQLS